eukprot:4570677-Karenia_brevis.AAC.1
MTMIMMMAMRMTMTMTMTMVMMMTMMMMMILTAPCKVYLDELSPEHIKNMSATVGPQSPLDV